MTTPTERVFENDQRLVLLLRLAVRALAEEDASLARAFAQGMVEASTFYGGRNHGLAYCVYETQIVYQVFKSWLPHERVRSEYAAYREAQKRADLVVLDDQDRPRWVFEAKWWGRDTSRMRACLETEIAKLGSCSSAAARKFLLTFWWTENADAAGVAQAEVDAFCTRNDGVHLRYTDSFPTDCAASASRRGLFTVALLEVGPRLLEVTSGPEQDRSR